MGILENENLTGVNQEGARPNIPLQFLTASSIMKDKVRNRQGEDMGKIEDIMIDVTSGKIEYVVIAFGGFLTINEKYFAIPWRLLEIDAGNKCFILDQPKEKIEKAPGFDMDHWPETNLHGEDRYWSFV